MFLGPFRVESWDYFPETARILKYCIGPALFQLEFFLLIVYKRGPAGPWTGLFVLIFLDQAQRKFLNSLFGWRELEQKELWDKKIIYLVAENENIRDMSKWDESNSFNNRGGVGN
jgi:hypothetical protein